MSRVIPVATVFLFFGLGFAPVCSTAKSVHEPEFTERKSFPEHSFRIKLTRIAGLSGAVIEFTEIRFNSVDDVLLVHSQGDSETKYYPVNIESDSGLKTLPDSSTLTTLMTQTITDCSRPKTRDASYRKFEIHWNHKTVIYRIMPWCDPTPLMKSWMKRLRVLKNSLQSNRSRKKTS